MTVTAHLEGWFLFCPIWLAEHEGEAIPIPKPFCAWLFEVALWVQQASNYIGSLFIEDSGGFQFRVYPCAPREFEVADFVNE